MQKANVFLGSTEITIGNYIQKNGYLQLECSVDMAKNALEIAKLSFVNAKKSPLYNRIEWLKDVISKLKQQKEEIAKTITLEVGKPIYFSRIEVDRCIETLELSIYAISNMAGSTYDTTITKSGKETISYYKREPVGVIVAITPFNFPLNLVAHKIAPALISGNTVVLKPTPEAPLTAYKFVKLFVESEYAIKDAISLVYGDADVGNALVSSKIPRVISFTGSVGVGNIITKNAGIKKISLELGGNAGTYIDKSANIEYSAKRTVFGAFVNSGQVCISLQRIYVDNSIYDEFAKYLVDETQKLVVGDPFDDKTFVGPLINIDAVNRAKEWIDEAKNEGAKLLIGGKNEGLLFYPTVMSEVRDDMNIVCQEVFAPIVSLIRVDSFDEALSKINNSDYGLQHSIFTRDIELIKRAIDEFECGGVVVNDIPTLRFDVQPYGGIKLSGVGREGPKFAIEEFTELKSVVIC